MARKSDPTQLSSQQADATAPASARAVLGFPFLAYGRLPSWTPSLQPQPVPWHDEALRPTRREGCSQARGALSRIQSSMIGSRCVSNGCDAGTACMHRGRADTTFP